MKIVIQRVKEARVEVKKKIIGEIKNGFLLLVGVSQDDKKDDIDYLVRKIINMRIFEDDEGKMNLSLVDKNYDILSISQFTLYADTKKGNRPGFSQAAHPDLANKLYERFNEGLRKENIKVETGAFGEHMDISLINDGPVTIIIDSKNK